MKTRIVTLLLAVALTAQFAFAGSLSNFGERRAYDHGAFSDVPPSVWYAENVSRCYELGLVDGMPGGLFSPQGYVTIAESVKMAVTLHSIYETGTGYAPGNGAVWYAPYVRYASDSGIIKSGEYSNYDARATRADFARIIANALPEEALAPLSSIPDGRIPDVSESYSYGSAVYMLYRAGVLTGAGCEGEFYPNLPITRAEAATALLRMADSTRRVYVQKAGRLTAEELYEKCAPAVVFIEVFDEDGELLKRGSGFFIDENGLVVTNCHVIGDAEYAHITLASGETRKILGIYGYDMSTDCALIQIEGGGYPTLEIASYELKTGADIYTIGNPIGLVNSYSKGIISMREREIDGMTYIQIDAAISSGSSGGALLDAAGRVIGITSAAITGGQSLNLAMPISVIDVIDTGALYDLGKAPSEDKLYEGYFPAPDFGAYSGLATVGRTYTNGALLVTYSLGYILEYDELNKLTEGYIELLEKYWFRYYGGAGTKELYYNSMFGRILSYNIIGIGRSRTMQIEIF